MNKYERVPDYILDLHGKTTKEAREILDAFLFQGKYKHVRVITGKQPLGKLDRFYVAMLWHT